MGKAKYCVIIVVHLLIVSKAIYKAVPTPGPNQDNNFQLILLASSSLASKQQDLDLRKVMGASTGNTSLWQQTNHLINFQIAFLLLRQWLSLGMTAFPSPLKTLKQASPQKNAVQKYPTLTS